MDMRIGIIAVIVSDSRSISQVNSLISLNSSLITTRLGLPMRDKGVSFISLIVSGTSDQIGAFAGKLGQLSGVKAKSLLAPPLENSCNL
jgi:putative iron-only hydrogenase system regulator